MQFLMGLNAAFDSVRDHILSADPLPTLDKAFYLVQQSKEQKYVSGMINLELDSSAVHAGKFSGSGNQQNCYKRSEYGSNSHGGNSLKGSYRLNDDKRLKENLKCTFCNKKGHLREQGFKLVGYPDWYKGSKGEASGKMTATVKTNGRIDTPFEEGETGARNTQALINAVCSEVLKVMKEQSGNAMTNFAGKLLGGSGIWL